MAAPSCVFTTARVALMLGKDEDLRIRPPKAAFPGVGAR